MIKDIRFAARSLLKRPAFTLIAVLTLALGIGANTAIFSVVNATLMRTPPVSDPERLVFVFNGPAGNVFSYPDYAALRDQNNVFDGLIAWGGIAASLNSNDQTDLVSGAIVTGNFFDVLGVRAQRGRVITTEDDKTPGAHPVVVISQGLWQGRFGGDPNIIGRQLLLNGSTFTVIGVLPAGFDGLQLGVVRDLYVPMMMQATMRPPRAGYSGEMNPDLLQVRGNRWLFSVGRLKPGVTESQAQSSLAAIAKQLEETYPQVNRGRTVSLSPLSASDNPNAREQLSSVAWLLMGVVGIVLLIACANVANLLLARSSARTKEIAVMGIALLQGRDFNTQDTEDHPPVVIVNEAFVRRHFPNADAVGKRLSFNGPKGPWREIVGVVRTSKYRSLGEAPAPLAYVPLQQNHETGMALHVRTSVDPSSVAGAIRNEVQSLEKNLPLGNPELMSERVANSLYAARMGAILLGVFGGLALLLASIGLYGVLSFAVARRTRELGIRVALGARPGDVFRLVLQQGMTLVIAGLVLGVGVAAVVTRLLASFLYGVSTTDAFTFTAIPALLTLVALLACYLPARKATKVEPLIALRYE